MRVILEPQSLLYMMAMFFKIVLKLYFYFNFLAIKSTVVGGQYLSNSLYKSLTDKRVQVTPRCINLRRKLTTIRYLFERKKLNTGKFSVTKIARPGATNSYHHYQVMNIVDDIKKSLYVPDRDTGYSRLFLA